MCQVHSFTPSSHLFGAAEWLHEHHGHRADDIIEKCPEEKLLRLLFLWRKPTLLLAKYAGTEKIILVDRNLCRLTQNYHNVRS